jgi:hypothetical protein
MPSHLDAQFVRAEPPSKLIDDPEIIGFHILPKGRGNEQPVPGSLYAWAANRLSASSSSLAQVD